MDVDDTESLAGQVATRSNGVMGLFSRLFSLIFRRRPSPPPPPPDPVVRIDIRSLFEEAVQNFIHQSLEQYEPKGAPPASEEDIANLPLVTLCPADLSEEVDGDARSCTVCRADYAVGQHVLVLPCTHRFCPHCIIHWLGLHRTCPMCRSLVSDVPALGPREWRAKARRMHSLGHGSFGRSRNDSGHNFTLNGRRHSARPHRYGSLNGSLGGSVESDDDKESGGAAGGRPSSTTTPFGCASKDSASSTGGDNGAATDLLSSCDAAASCAMMDDVCHNAATACHLVDGGVILLPAPPSAITTDTALATKPSTTDGGYECQPQPQTYEEGSQQQFAVDGSVQGCQYQLQDVQKELERELEEAVPASATSADKYQTDHHHADTSSSDQSCTDGGVDYEADHQINQSIHHLVHTGDHDRDHHDDGVDNASGGGGEGEFSPLLVPRSPPSIPMPSIRSGRPMLDLTPQNRIPIPRRRASESLRRSVFEPGHIRPPCGDSIDHSEVAESSPSPLLPPVPSGAVPSPPPRPRREIVTSGCSASGAPLRFMLTQRQSFTQNSPPESSTSPTTTANSTPRTARCQSPFPLLDVTLSTPTASATSNSPPMWTRSVVPSPSSNSSPGSATNVSLSTNSPGSAATAHSPGGLSTFSLSSDSGGSSIGYRSSSDRHDSHHHEDRQDTSITPRLESQAVTGSALRLIRQAHTTPALRPAGPPPPNGCRAAQLRTCSQYSLPPVPPPLSSCPVSPRRTASNNRGVLLPHEEIERGGACSRSTSTDTTLPALPLSRCSSVVPDQEHRMLNSPLSVSHEIAPACWSDVHLLPPIS